MQIIGECVTGLDGRTYRVGLEQDQDAESPRDFDCNNGTIVVHHRDYLLPHEGDLTSVIDDALERGGYRLAARYLMATGQALVVLPVYLYDHGTLHVSVGSSDGGQFANGLVYASPASVREGWGDDTPGTDVLTQALTIEVEEYDRWATGEVYGYVVERQAVRCACCGRGAGEWEHVDALWGLIGYDYAEGEARDALQDVLDTVAAEVVSNAVSP